MHNGSLQIRQNKNAKRANDDLYLQYISGLKKPIGLYGNIIHDDLVIDDADSGIEISLKSLNSVGFKLTDEWQNLTIGGFGTLVENQRTPTNDLYDFFLALEKPESK